MKDIDDIDVSKLPLIEELEFWEHLAHRLAEELKGATTAGVVRLDEAITEVELRFDYE